MNEKVRPRRHRSTIVAEIKQNQNPLVAARSKKKLMLAAKIADALEQKDLKKTELAELLNKYSSEVTRWTSGDHNFTADTLSDLEEVLGIELLHTQKKTHPKVQPTLALTLTVDVSGMAQKKASKSDWAHVQSYIALAGGMQAATITTYPKPIAE